MSANTDFLIALEASTRIYPIPSPEQLLGGSAALLQVKTMDSICMGSYFGKTTTELLCLCRGLGKQKPSKAIASGRQQRDGAVRPKVHRGGTWGKEATCCCAKHIDFYQSSCPVCPPAQRWVTQADPPCSGDECQWWMRLNSNFLTPSLSCKD